jgi:hypothetical protein
LQEIARDKSKKNLEKKKTGLVRCSINSVSQITHFERWKKRILYHLIPLILIAHPVELYLQKKNRTRNEKHFLLCNDVSIIDKCLKRDCK